MFNCSLGVPVCNMFRSPDIHVHAGINNDYDTSTNKVLYHNVLLHDSISPVTIVYISKHCSI